MSELEEKLARRRASIEEHDKQQAQLKSQSVEAQNTNPEKLIALQKEKESDDDDEVAYRASLQALRDDVTSEVKQVVSGNEVTFPMSPDSRVEMLEGEASIRVTTGGEGKVVAINGANVACLKNSVEYELRTKEVTSVTLALNTSNDFVDLDSTLKDGGNELDIPIQDGWELLSVSMQDRAPLGVTVVAADVNPINCGGLRVSAIPAPSCNEPPIGLGLKLRDVIIRVNDIMLTTLSPSDAAAIVRNSSNRKLFILRHSDKVDESSDGNGERDFAATDNIENNINQSSSKIKKRKGSYLCDVDEWSTSSASNEIHGIKKRMITRSRTRTLYAAGEKVTVDYTRQRPPTLMADELLPGRVCTLDEGAYVQAAKRMKGRFTASDALIKSLH
jgi:hypothetical protein